MTEKRNSARDVSQTAKSQEHTGNNSIDVVTQEHAATQVTQIPNSPFTIFMSESFGKLRTTQFKDETYFAATDVAAALGYARPRNAIKMHCDHSLKRGGVSYTTNQHGTTTLQKTQMNYIPLSDVLRLVVNSKLPAAKAYERWVFEEVLPSINRSGVYETEGHRAAAAVAASQPPAIDMTALQQLITPMIEMLRVMNRRLDRLEDRQYALPPVSNAGRKPAPASRIAPSPRYDMAYTVKEALPVLDREYGVVYNTTGINNLTGIYRDLVKYGYIYKDRLGYHPTAAARSAGHIIEETISTLSYGDRNYEKTRVKITDAGLKSFSDTLRESLCGRRISA